MCTLNVAHATILQEAEALVHLLVHLAADLVLLILVRLLARLADQALLTQDRHLLLRALAVQEVQDTILQAALRRLRTQLRLDQARLILLRLVRRLHRVRLRHTADLLRLHQRVVALATIHRAVLRRLQLRRTDQLHQLVERTVHVLQQELRQVLVITHHLLRLELTVRVLQLERTGRQLRQERRLVHVITHLLHRLEHTVRVLLQERTVHLVQQVHVIIHHVRLAQLTVRTVVQ